ncbi:uncharacterized protein BJ212DRAFT_1302341 [Suillus subaureus]|uniref:Fungal-type protein kinase domain-containing protein n=1 Tax=Suillus subaureus TaxID=48587 RepID=A0A9P7E4L6_9AGAM|nr:uncharacterized protein BJ212DRAFT_1302341 [Suillus subaureus]KAG1810601.1 hypothetical protein BJ212DRAFT_1302341 [Suillus subaureus]
MEASPPPLMQATTISSAPLVNLTSQAPWGPENIYLATPHPSQFPYSTRSPEPCGKILVRDTIYTIKRILFAGHGLVSRGTVCYLVCLDDEEFIIKDHWVQGREDQVVLNEINMLKHMSGIPGVPELVDWWIVERSNGEADVTSRYRKQPQCLKLVKVLRDIVIIQCMAVEEHKVLHCNCSLNNAMITDELGGGSRGFLIDWEFMVHINLDLKYAIGGMGTIPFMSHGLLTQLSDAQQAALISHVIQSFSDDLESLFFIFIWICIKFCGPNGQVHQDQLRNSIPDCWNNMDLKSCTAFKGNFFATAKEEHHLIDEIHPYFKDLIPLAKEWCSVLKDNMENPVSFNNILLLLNSHLDCLPDDKELISTVKTLRESAAILTDHVKKHIASQSLPVGLPELKHRKSDADSHDESDC